MPRPDYSEDVAREIDNEILRIVEEAREQALETLTEHFDELQLLSELLIEHETIDRDQVRETYCR